MTRYQRARARAAELAAFYRALAGYAVHVFGGRRAFGDEWQERKAQEIMTKGDQQNQ